MHLPRHMTAKGLGVGNTIPHIRCPICDGPMVRRVRKVDNHPFYGCRAFRGSEPGSCRGARDSFVVDAILEKKDPKALGYPGTYVTGPVDAPRLERRAEKKQKSAPVPFKDDGKPRLVRFKTVPREVSDVLGITDSDLGVYTGSGNPHLQVVFHNAVLDIPKEDLEFLGTGTQLIYKPDNSSSDIGPVCFNGKVWKEQVSGAWMIDIARGTVVQHLDITQGDVLLHSNKPQENSPMPTSSPVSHPAVSRAFEGETVVFTGELPSLIRANAQKVVMENGGRSFSNNITNGTTLVVIGTKPGGKARDARNRGIRTMTGDEFESFLRKQGIHPKGTPLPSPGPIVEGSSPWERGENIAVEYSAEDFVGEPEPPKPVNPHAPKVTLPKMGEDEDFELDL